MDIPACCVGRNGIRRSAYERGVTCAVHVGIGCIRNPKDDVDVSMTLLNRERNAESQSLW
ncbi:hypothetical protein BIFDEN_00017 [Bifidobacterium dentium ATCC 27678]|nr:hypothetical protein BIFDEN_00017 [Bifidobacterium dentium ATCC 27678]